jgi:hypothetical protein
MVAFLIVFFSIADVKEQSKNKNTALLGLYSVRRAKEVKYI